MSQINQVKEATSIIELIGSRVTLQRSGANYKGLCPFHTEKSPSFFVSEDMQRYKCFGCGRAGDVFTFLEEYEGMTFREALETLAQASGIELASSAPETAEDRERSEILTVLDLARAYYHYLLTEHAVGEPARVYLAERGVQQLSVRQYQLGYALPQWDGLVTYLHTKKKCSHDILIKAGLASRGAGGRVYDRFRSRLMFPLRNHRGQVVGFSGRIMGTDIDKETPKYINTPETSVYHKGQMLFGFYENLQAIRKEKKVIVVEGEFDVISSGEAHVSTVVAIKGSALTLDHVKLLSRSVDHVILCLDADDAGVAATRKAIEVMRSGETSREQPLALSVVQIPTGKDPDDLSRSDPKAWRELVKHPSTAYEFLITAACKKHDPHTPTGKTKIMQELKPILKPLAEKNAVEFEYYTKTLAEQLEASLSSVQKDILAFTPLQKRNTTTEPEQPSLPVPQTRRMELEQYVLFLIVNAAPAERVAWAEEYLRLTEQTELQVPRKVLTALTQAGGALKDVLSDLPADLQAIILELGMNPKYYSMLETVDLAKEWQSACADFAAELAREAGQKIEAELEELDRISPKTPEQEERQATLLTELVRLRKTKKL